MYNSQRKNIIKNLLDNEVRFAASKALNATAKKIKKSLQDEMDKVFVNPTPYVKNGIYTTAAKKNNLMIKIGLKDKWAAGKGHAAADVLAAEISGGIRQPKASEVLLQEKGYLRPGQVWVPGKGQRLNKYGNITGGQITQLLSVLGAHREVGFIANRTAQSKLRNKKSPNLFYVGPGKRLPEGIWERKGKRQLKSRLLFIDAPSYQKRFRFEEIIEEVGQKEIVTEFDKAIDEVFK